MSWGYMSQGVYVLGGKCPRGKCPGGKCLGVYVLGVSVQGVHVQGGYVLEPPKKTSKSVEGVELRLCPTDQSEARGYF